MKKRGALYEKAKLPFVSYAVVDGNLVTGHNPRTRQGNGLEGGPLSCVSRRPRCCGYPPPVDSGLLGVRLEQDIDGREREDHERAHLLGGAHVLTREETMTLNSTASVADRGTTRSRMSHIVALGK